MASLEYLIVNQFAANNSPSGISRKKSCFFAPPALGPNSDLRLARSTLTKPDFKMIGRRGGRAVTARFALGNKAAAANPGQPLHDGPSACTDWLQRWHRYAAARLLAKALSLSRLHQEQGCRPRQPATPGKVVISQGCGRNRQPNGAHHGISRTNHHAAYPAPRSRAYARRDQSRTRHADAGCIRLDAVG
jgi:hypothetical protein